MAYGGGFLGGLSEFAGGMAQGIERAKKLKMEQEAAARDTERFGREKKAWAREDTLNELLGKAPKVGEVIGSRAKPLFSGASEEEANNFVTGYAPQPAAVPAPAPQVAPQAGLPVAPPPVQEGATFKQAFAPYEKAALPPQEPAPQQAPQQAPQPAAPAKLVTYYDPMRKTYNVVQEDAARRANEADVAAYEVAAYRAAGDVKTARALERDALEMISLRSDVNRKRALDTLDKSMLSGDPMAGLNSALNILNADDNITLGANFSVMQTKDGKYTIGAAPDGSGLEPRPLPKNMFGEYKDPTQLFQAVRAVVDGKFGEFQNTVFNQQMSLQELGLRERAQKLSEDRFAFDKMDSNRNYGLRRAAAAASSASSGGIPGYVLKTETGPDGETPRNVYMPKKPGGVALVEGPGGEIMPKRYADNPAALKDAVKAVYAAGGTSYRFDANGDMYAIIPGQKPRRIIHRPKR